MQNKLQELTEKLYNEGLSKGKEEGEKILSDARRQAEEIVDSARRQAEEILRKAGDEASALKQKVDSDLKAASAQCIQATKKDIENIIVATLEKDRVSQSLQDTEFLKEIIRAAAKGFSSDSSLEITLPSSLEKELGPWVCEELAKAVGKGIHADFSKKIAGGFTIGPKDGGWFVSFTDETFNELISGYLRPVTRKLLFGE